MNTRQGAGTRISAYQCPSDPQNGEWVQCSGVAAGHVGPDPLDQVGLSDMCVVGDSIDWTSDGTWPMSFPQVDGVMGANEPCRIADIRDGTSNTLMIGEVTGMGAGTHHGHFWVSWNILDTAEGINGLNTVPGGTYPDPPNFRLAGFASFHPGGCNFALADGSVSFLSQNIADAILKALTTRDGMNHRSYTVPATELMISGPP